MAAAGCLFYVYCFPVKPAWPQKVTRRTCSAISEADQVRICCTQARTEKTLFLEE